MTCFWQQGSMHPGAHLLTQQGLVHPIPMQT